MRSLLVTGGAGFIGSNFVRYMLRTDPVVAIVNYDKLTYAGNLENLADVLDNPRHKFVKGDIADGAKVRSVLREHGIDAVVHFAAETHVDRSIMGSSVFVETNIVGTHVLLEAVREHGVEKFIHVSTDEVYGSLGSSGRFTEATPVHPNSPYAASKASSDLMGLAYHHTYGVPVVVTRCSNNYGPCQFPEKLIPLMIINAVNDERLPVYGDGLHVRDWLFVEDHSRAIQLTLLGGDPGEVYNIGGDNEWKNIDIVKLILSELGKPFELISFVKDRPGHDRRYAIDAGKIRSKLGWKPASQFEEGLRETIRWYLDHKEWCDHVTSGEYKDYYRVMYHER